MFIPHLRDAGRVRKYSSRYFILPPKDKIGLVAPMYRNATVLITNIITALELFAKEARPLKNILMTIKDCDTTTIASPIVNKTIELASNCSSKVDIIHIVPPQRQPPYNVDSKIFHEEVTAEIGRKNDYLQHLAKFMQDKSIDATSRLIHGPIISTILHESERLAVDLVIIGRHDKGPLYRALMNNTDKGLLAKCSCSVMFVPV